MTLTVTKSTFSANSAGDGSCIGNKSGTLIVTDSTFSGNGPGVFGGGISNHGGRLMVTSSTFSGNSANEGGGISNLSGGGTITNCTFSGNTAPAIGGGGGAGVGGAIFNGGALTIDNSTFSANSANGVGGGGGISGTATFKSTILAASSSGGNCAGSVTDAGYNISDDASCGFAKTGSANNGDDVNPLLSTAGLAHNGGPTETIALQSGSPAIDAIPVGSCSLGGHPITTDQRGFPRPDAGEAACDIGAFEIQDARFTTFARFGGNLRIDPDAGIFFQGGGFVLKPGSSIDPTTEPVAFSVGSYAVNYPGRLICQE